MKRWFLIWYNLGINGTILGASDTIWIKLFVLSRKNHHSRKAKYDSIFLSPATENK